jgi:hypothetical protein
VKITDEMVRTAGNASGFRLTAGHMRCSLDYQEPRLRSMIRESRGDTGFGSSGVK